MSLGVVLPIIENSLIHLFLGLLLLLVPGRRLKNFGNILLMATKILNLYTHWAINDKFERMAPSLVFFFMLVEH